MTSFLARLLPLALAILAFPIAAEEVLPQTRPVALDETETHGETLGELTFLGGVEIEAGEAKIGGLSALEWRDGTLFAVSDDGRWFAMTPDEIDGRLVDVIAIETGSLRDLRGKRLKKKQDADAESLALTSSSEWLVAFEQDHRIWRYPGFENAATEAKLPIADLALGAKANSGLEALAQAPEGVLACGEWAGEDRPNCMRESGEGLVGFEIAPPDELAGRSAVPTGADCAGDGTCYILFRSYSPDRGNAAAILALGPDNETKTLAALLPPLTLDNFEGIAVREEQGRTYLYIVSDNNFSSRQRTLLMKFEVASARDDSALAPPPTKEVDAATYETVSVVLETELGDITIALETERAPVTAANFLRYVDEGRFDGTSFYRAMRLDREPRPNGLIQGGTRWDPERILPGIRHEPTTETGLSHTNGALSMAMGEPGTANGDFSIMLQDQTGLDARPDASEEVWRNGYAVFGYVTEGMDVVAAIHAAPTDPALGEGAMAGQMLAKPVKIIRARRAQMPTQ